MSPYGLIAAANVVGGASYAVAQSALGGFAPRDLLVLRLALTALLFAPLAWRARARLSAASAPDWARMAGVGLLGYALPLGLGLYGQSLSTSTSASLLVGMEPVTIVLLSSAFLGERLTPLRALALLSGVAGTALIVLQGSLAGALTARGRGDAVLALHGCCWALYTVLGKSALERVRPVDFTAATTLIGAAGAAAWAAPGLAPASWPAAPAAAWGSVAVLAAGVGLAGPLLWNAALERIEASRAASFIFLQPAVGVALGTLVQGEPLTRWSAAGGALVAAGMWAATRG